MAEDRAPTRASPTWPTQMTEHHRDAVAMAETEIAGGEDAGAVEMATTIAETRAAAIEEMEQVLQAL